ncbi:Gfo/Idh/MocA family protein [Motilibacter aurantiacus]|uniref:Gfo/Idh/MocA family protein n=1 Tax=Motilibacter aurantiacus TaxID=2714955 RepID=UPI00140D0925|nr:Gfo/Idh/MocA family oxidoreductase [Motilibacter aurantiacus]
MAGDVRWGFLGAGAMARNIAPCVHAARGARLQAAAARDAGRALRLGPAGSAYDDYELLLQDPDVDAVYIALNNDAHLPMTLRALEAGKHVLCEKPLGLSGAEARRMATAAEAADKLVVEAFWYRWHPRTRRAEALVKAGLLGEVTSVTSTFTGGVTEDLVNYRYDPARGGGALYDVGCYAVSAALWAAGAAPLKQASGELELHPSGVDLAGTAQLTLGRTTADVRFGMSGQDVQEVVVEGTEGRLAIRESAFVSRYEVAELHVDDRVERFAPVDPYQLMFEAVSARIRGEADTIVEIAESIRIADAIDAVFAAARGA